MTRAVEDFAVRLAELINADYRAAGEITATAARAAFANTEQPIPYWPTPGKYWPIRGRNR